MKKTVKKLFVVCLMLLALTITGQAKTYAIISRFRLKKLFQMLTRERKNLTPLKLGRFC